MGHSLAQLGHATTAKSRQNRLLLAFRHPYLCFWEPPQRLTGVVPTGGIVRAIRMAPFTVLHDQHILLRHFHFVS